MILSQYTPGLGVPAVRLLFLGLSAPQHARTHTPAPAQPGQHSSPQAWMPPLLLFSPPLSLNNRIGLGLRISENLRNSKLGGSEQES